MIDIENYIQQLIDLLIVQFDERLVYVGLQGSYLRGEATPNSDIDIMVVIDELGMTDLESYRSAILSLEHFDKSCGFICSKADLANWNPLEMCHLVNTTKDYFGILRELIPAYTEDDIRNFVKLSINNLYHGICHSYVHAESNQDAAALTGVYKGVFFILQNLHYLRHGQFIAGKSELLPVLKGKDYAVMERAVALHNGAKYDFADSFELLFTWCQETLKSVSKLRIPNGKE